MRHSLMMRTVGMLAAGLLLAGCATSTPTRTLDDGVYIGSSQLKHLSARQVAVLNPRTYPFWSIDFFYFSHYYGPTRTRTLYEPPLIPSIGPCERWARHLCLEELYTRHLYLRMRAERDDFWPTSTGRRSAEDYRIRALNSGAELHLAHRVGEARRTAASSHHATSQHQTRRDSRDVSSRSAGLRDRGSVAHRSRSDHGRSLAGNSGSRMSTARASHQPSRSSARGSVAAGQSTSISELEP